MLSRLAQRFSITNTSFLLLLTGASAIFAYLVSPTRDPAFGKFAARSGGSSLWWLQGVHEDHWELAAFILAGLLAINFTLKLWQWYKSKTLVDHQQGIPRKTAQLWDFLFGIVHFVIGILIWMLLFYGFFIFLLDQWLID